MIPASGCITSAFHQVEDGELPIVAQGAWVRFEAPLHIYLEPGILILQSGTLDKAGKEPLPARFGGVP